jgi:hypothetical protein
MLYHDELEDVNRDSHGEVSEAFVIAKWQSKTISADAKYIVKNLWTILFVLPVILGGLVFLLAMLNLR